MMQLPPYAHVPGFNGRHPGDAFDAIRETAFISTTVEELAKCDAFFLGLKFLESGYYWEAHEVLEPVWMGLPSESTERRFVQGVIQLANGCLKLRMKRPKAALRLVQIARELMPPAAVITVMTLSVLDVHGWIDHLEEKSISAL